MQAIETKLLPCTNTKPYRVVARASGGGRAVVSADGSDKGYGHVETHALAAQALCRRMGWTGTLIAGGTKAGFVFVLSDGERFTV